MTQDQMKELAQNFRDNVEKILTYPTAQEEIQKIKELDSYIKKTPDLEIVYEQRDDVEIIERIIEGKVPKKETVYILDSTKKVMNSYNSRQK